MKYLFFSILFIFLSTSISMTQPNKLHNLNFNKLPSVWDEALPLGNGVIGALIWKKNNSLRLSIDRADLWDETFIEDFNIPQFSYQWVYDQVKKGAYDTVQKLFDLPYEKYPTPTKIPCAALEFNIAEFGEIESADVNITNALCTITWKNGVKFKSFIHAKKQFGYYRFENIDKDIIPYLIPPAYVSDKLVSGAESNSVDGADLINLGFDAPVIKSSNNSIEYIQKVKKYYEYKVIVKWKRKGKTIEGFWRVENSKPYFFVGKECAQKGFDEEFKSHLRWWNTFWSKSSIKLPDKKLERQYYLELYKFGSTARSYAPPITLQAVWTADNGKIPPWKGDIHNDLNTQLSYWLSYSGNRLKEQEGFLNWLWDIRKEAKEYTKRYFNCEGLNIPGVSTLKGKAMGGWIQYSLSPTVSAWLAHHFYLHWRYSMDRKFLKERAFPFISEVAQFLENVTVIDEKGFRKLPISSSPEINDNRIDAWFKTNTNYDLALMKWVFEKAAELANELKLKDKHKHFKNILNEFQDFAIHPEKGLLVAEDYPLKESHRHFSHLMAIHPLGLIKADAGSGDKKIINNSLRELERLGSSWWVGYSFSWLGSLYARAREGDKAYEALRTFSDCFCLPNSFHVNGDQSGTKKSNFTYRPFTLEGNFAFASSLQEMLLQSHNGYIDIFPAIPENWKDLSFSDLRAEGAFLVSSEMRNGEVIKIAIQAEKGGDLIIKNPFIGKDIVSSSKTYTPENFKKEFVGLKMKKGEIITIELSK